MKYLIRLKVLLILGITSLSALAESPWTIVYPGDPLTGGVVDIVHFRDRQSGWAAGYDSFNGQRFLLRTNDGGFTWQSELTDFHYEEASFINPLEGWTFRDEHFRYTPITDDIELYHTTDGGLTWQLQKGRIVEMVNINGEPLPVFNLKLLTKLHFIDAQHGWLIGYTEGIDMGATEKFIGHSTPHLFLEGNLFLSTKDGGMTWQAYIDVYPEITAPILEAAFGRPMDIDFVSRERGWISTRSNRLYRTTDGGITWEQLELPRDSEPHIDFVDAHNGWNVTWATHDGGQTWIKQAPAYGGHYMGPAYFMSPLEGWLLGQESLSNKISEKRIYHTADGGNTWDVEWQIQTAPIDLVFRERTSITISYIGYDEATGALWAGGRPGILLKRSIKPSPVSVSPTGRLITTWGQIKQNAK